MNKDEFINALNKMDIKKML